MIALIPRLPARAAVALTLMLALAGPAGRVHVAMSAPSRPPVRGLADAERLALTPGADARDRTLADWARDARLHDLVWLLRRNPSELGKSELVLVDAALARTPATRTGLYQRLLARRALAAPRPLRKGETPLPDLAPLRPWASMFRVALLLPDQGEYASYSRAVRVAVAEGLRWGRPAGARAIELDTLGTGDNDPARVAAAFQQAIARCDVLVGELLSGPTLSLATAASSARAVLVSPTATDERIGRIGRHAFQVGPGADDRARVLADRVLGREPHVVAITGSAAGVVGAFADAFAAEVLARGGKVVLRAPARTLATEAAVQARAFKDAGVDVLFWDGPARDAETLLRVLASEGVALLLCGGPSLAPEGMRPPARALLEGVAWVADDWQLPATPRAHLDSLASAAGVRAGSLWTRGFLAGRAIAAAVDGGALGAEEVARALRHADAALAAGGFLDTAREGATLPLFVVRGGKAVVVPELTPR